VCGKAPCECPKEPCPVCGQRPCVAKKKKAKVKLADGKERAIQHMMCTTFWHPDGTPMSAQQFMEMLFRQTAGVLQRRAELRADCGARRIRARSCCKGLARKVSATSNWPRCRRSSMPRRATCSTCWRMWPTPAAAHARGTRRHAKGLYQLRISTRQAAGVSRFRAVALREASAWRNSTRTS
jgi:hypothetical protein